MSAFRAWHGKGMAAFPAEIHPFRIIKLAVIAFHGREDSTSVRVQRFRVALFAGLL
jgi:hypothetical protein